MVDDADAYGTYYASETSALGCDVFVADLDDDDKQDVLYADETNGSGFGWRRPATSTTDWGSSLTIDDDQLTKRNGSWPPTSTATTTSTSLRGEDGRHDPPVRESRGSPDGT